MIKKNKKNLLVILLAFSILGIILSFTGYHNTINEIEIQGFKELLRFQTKTKLDVTKDYISSMVYDLESTANLTQEYESIYDEKVREIISMSDRMNIFSYTAIVDQTGNGYSQNGSTFCIKEQEYFKKVMEGKVSFSDVRSYEKISGKYVQIIACPTWSNNGKVNGAVLGVLDLDNLNDIFEQQNEKTNGNIYIIDSNGNYISKFQIDESQTKYNNFWKYLEAVDFLDKDISEIKKDFNKREEGDFSFSIKGEHNYGCYMPIGANNWQIVYTVKDVAIDKKLNTVFKMDIKYTFMEFSFCLIWLLYVIWYFRNTNKEIKQANYEVSKNNEILHIALEYSKKPIFEYIQESRELILKTDFPNPLFENVNKKVTPEELVNKNLIDTKSVHDFLQLFKNIKIQQYTRADIQINTKSKAIWYRISLHNINKNNHVANVIGFVEDITEIKKMEQITKRKLELQDALVSKALLYAKVDIEKENLLELNGEEILISYHDFLQEQIVNHVRVEDKKNVSKELSLKTLYEKNKQGMNITEEQFMMEFNGEMRWVSCMLYYHVSKSSKLILIVSDIDYKKRKEIALQYQAERDGLTGLYNAITSRIKIEEALISGYLSNEKQVFILFDLDNYKQINDNFGHDYGDKVLKEVANVMKNRFRSSDIVGRMGGDEFVILLRNMRSYQYAEILIKQLCEIIHKTYKKDGHEVTISASVGIVQIPENGKTFTELYKKADLALYQVKKEGKNSYKYYDK